MIIIVIFKSLHSLFGKKRKIDILCMVIIKNFWPEVALKVILLRQFFPLSKNFLKKRMSFQVNIASLFINVIIQISRASFEIEPAMTLQKNFQRQIIRQKKENCKVFWLFQARFVSSCESGVVANFVVCSLQTAKTKKHVFLQC